MISEAEMILVVLGEKAFRSYQNKRKEITFSSNLFQNLSNLIILIKFVKFFCFNFKEKREKLR